MDKNEPHIEQSEILSQNDEAKRTWPLNAASFEFYPDSDKIKSVRYHEPESPEYAAIIRQINSEMTPTASKGKNFVVLVGPPKRLTDY